MRYHFLAPMLLDEIQKQRHRIEDQERFISEQAARIRNMEERLLRLEGRGSDSIR